MTFPRASGILLHPTSLPGPFGIGDLGDEAYHFADFLVAGGQSLWQVLPLGPTGYGDSPYACYSAFAGNTLLISPEKLFEEGLLLKSDLDEIPSPPTERVDFERVQKTKEIVLAKAFARYQRTTDTELRSAFETFAEQNASWLDDYALFRALKSAHGGQAWHEWDRPLVGREPAALARSGDGLHDQIEAHKFFQFHILQTVVCAQGLLQRTQHQPGSATFRSSWPTIQRMSGLTPDQFKLDQDGRPTVVAGVPPDYFSATGQFWGNPLYDWDRMLADGFKWWIERVRATLQTVDIARIDHFRGFAACWEIPASDTTAERGRWVEAPGRELFTAIRGALREIPIIAEDLGVITPDVEKLRDDFGFPGMRILQFAFSSDTKNIDLPHNYHRNVVVYTGTHDNDTTVGWFNSVAGAGSTRTEAQISSERNFGLEYLNTNGQEIHWDFIRAVLASVADTAIVPLQDLLGLGTEARMNLPNSTQGNWSWRFKQAALTEDHSQRLRSMTDTYGRIRRREVESVKLDQNSSV